MKTFSLATLASHMKELDICMMVTQGKRSGLNSRPMSNNKDVTYKGDSYFFTYEKSAKVKELEANTSVSLIFEGKEDLFISVMGKAKLIRNKNSFAEHWVDSLAQWFKDGIETKGMVLIHVKATKIKYWQNEKQGEIAVGKK
ncbi:MAG: pyridoxamine 5'-phosphate oxidase family protein [Gloeobacteraceae cyanobacterium ES-bin-316]|nr:pyridoxamine 5'-phosphate oxidase family protein [Ferruginibacter sp.]